MPVTDTAGPGRFRGGNSLIREFRVLSDDVMLIVRSDKRDFPPHGLFGGGTGAPSWNIINPGPEQKIMPVTTTRPVALQKGDVFRHLMAGGGGFGDPLMREPQHVVDDVRAGRVSIAEARTAYGVVIDDHGALTFDAAATKTARESPSV